MFSIVLPLYNKEYYILKTVKSVLNQSYEEFELIIINDGSTDSSLEKLDSIKDKRIRLINQSNQGVSISRNQGIKESKCEYIAFIDADDIWDSNYLLEMKQLIFEYPKAKIYGANFYFVDGNKIKTANSGLKRGYTDNYFRLVRNSVVLHTSSTIVNSKALQTVGFFNSSIKRGEDLDLFVRLIRKFELAYLPEAKNKYFLNTENSSNQFVPLPEESFAYHAKFTEDSNYYEKLYLVTLIWKKFFKYLLIDKKVQYAFSLLYKQKSIMFNFFSLLFNH
ncbi:MAG: capsular biosynthesis protein CpsI [Flavobacteriaceae bacterium]|nr:capsular biosynthesis protein CpsI [Flavobacteriaceae bacterium]